jgi:hydroxymethylbilane synthase
MRIRLGALRQTPLARAQAALVAGRLRALGHEAPLAAAAEADALVHALKDAPLAARLPAMLERGSVHDLLLTRSDALDEPRPLGLRVGARVGAGSARRASQLRAARPDVEAVPVAGGLDARLDLLRRGALGSVAVAAAVFERHAPALPAEARARRLDPVAFPPAPGQGVLAVEAPGGSPVADALRALDHAPTRAAAEAERAVLAGLGGGCGLPLGAYARRAGDRWRLDATLGLPGGGLARARRTGLDAATVAARVAADLREAAAQVAARP